MFLENFKVDDFYTYDFDINTKNNCSIQQNQLQKKKNIKITTNRTQPNLKEYKLWLFFVATTTEQDNKLTDLLRKSYKSVISLKIIFEICYNGFVFTKFISQLYDVKIAAINESQKGFVNNNWKRAFLVLKEDVRIPTQFLFKINDLTSQQDFSDVFFGLLDQISQVFVQNLEQAEVYAQTLFNAKCNKDTVIPYNDVDFPRPQTKLIQEIIVVNPMRKPRQSSLHDMEAYLNHYRLPIAEDPSWHNLQHFQTLINLVMDQKYQLPFQCSKQAFQIIQNAKSLQEFLAKNNIFTDSARELQAPSQQTIYYIINRIMSRFPHLKLIHQSQFKISKQIEHEIITTIMCLGVLQKQPYNFDNPPLDFSCLLEYFNQGILLVDITQQLEWNKGNYIMIKSIRIPLTKAEKMRNFLAAAQYIGLDKSCQLAGVLVNSLDHVNDEIAMTILANILNINYKIKQEDHQQVDLEKASQNLHVFVSNGRLCINHRKLDIVLHDIPNQFLNLDEFRSEQ
ncbi:hypothetical protein SS50377_25436 [Spironucleus salmonicida]|uniref:Uncharacterized protein n=1 Tax=Spironucleus salmonicida TaxID=348837 RepID=V6LVY8_9EUKA|nr:hypothetical protein SS50377_25436 [Spironucleus salmonicida]|eukprot:EST44984.1 hypothetical protein SS50377_15003 [Spironucleus salmonicida]